MEEDRQSILLPFFFGASGILLTILFMFLAPGDTSIATIVSKTASELTTSAIALTIPFYKKNKEEGQSFLLPFFFGASGILLTILLMFFPPGGTNISTVVGKTSSDLTTGAIALTIPFYKKDKQD